MDRDTSSWAGRLGIRTWGIAFFVASCFISLAEAQLGSSAQCVPTPCHQERLHRKWSSERHCQGYGHQCRNSSPGLRLHAFMVSISSSHGPPTFKTTRDMLTQSSIHVGSTIASYMMTLTYALYSLRPFKSQKCITISFAAASLTFFGAE